jgi:hypothetical protein
MKSTGLLKGLSAIVVVGLLASTLVFFADTRPARAEPSKAEEQTGTTKVLIADLQPGEIVTAYVGSFGPGFDPSGATPNSATPAALDGKPVEVFVDVGKATSLYVTDPSGATRFLGVVAPARSDLPDTILSAAAIDLSMNRGLASPATNEGASMEAAPAMEAAPQSAAPSSFTRTHLIAEGDTLSALAQQYGTTVEELARANNIADPNLIIAGHTLMVP